MQSVDNVLSKYKTGEKVKVVSYQDENQWEKRYGIDVGDIVEVVSVNRYDYCVLSKTNQIVFIVEESLELVSKEEAMQGQTHKQMYTPLGVQQNGTHYKTKGIQPIEYTLANDLSFAQGNIVKYVTRHEDKNGLDDLAKSIHYHFFEALRVYGEQGSDELRKKVLELLEFKHGDVK